MLIDLMKKNLIPSFEDDPAGGGGDKPADDKPADDKPADDKPADDKPLLADDKPADDKPLLADDKPADDKPADDKPTLPEEYKFEAAEGKEIDESVSKLIGEFSKEHKLTQEQAQALYNRELETVAQAEADAVAQEAAIQKEWKETAQKDEILNEGGNYEENISVAKRGFKQLFPELAEIANELPFLDHPLVLRGMLRAGKLYSEDGDVIQGHAPSSTDADRVNKFYPTMVK